MVKNRNRSQTEGWGLKLGLEGRKDGDRLQNVEGGGAVDVNRVETRTPTGSAKPSFPAGFYIQTWPGASWLVGGS